MKIPDAIRLIYLLKHLYDFIYWMKHLIFGGRTQEFAKFPAF